jgi:hypothetical protein
VVEQEEIGFFCITGENIDFSAFGVAQNSTFLCEAALSTGLCFQKKKSPAVEKELGKIG